VPRNITGAKWIILKFNPGRIEMWAKVKVRRKKFTQEETAGAQRGSGGIALLN
jgi:hypothetical protein